MNEQKEPKPKKKIPLDNNDNKHIIFKYESDFDENGIFYALGTNFGKEPYTNPATTSKVTIVTSKMHADSQPSYEFIGRNKTRTLTAYSQPSFFYVDFGKYGLKPTHYTLRHYSTQGSYHLKHWEFQGSNDGENWICLKKHTDDLSLKGASKSHTWELPNDIDEYYSYFRVLVTGATRLGVWNLCCSGMELYGDWCDLTELIYFWPRSLLLNEAYANAFACIKCNQLPTICMNNEDGEILCEPCSKDVPNAGVAKGVQNLVNKLKTKCLTVNSEQKTDEHDEGNNVMATNISDECDWIGTIKDYDVHRKECQFLVITCADCKTYQCQRKLLVTHIPVCPEISIDCPLSCGSMILRKNKKKHIENDCMEQLLNCVNDDCKMRIKRKDIANHVNDECDARIVECEYAKYGCNVNNIKADQLQNHMEECKFEHLSKKFDHTINELKQHVMPKGTIVMWSGTADNIPKGWMLCNGNNDTPDLRNRFIIGAGDEYKNQSVGGSKTHTHNIEVGDQNQEHGYGYQHGGIVTASTNTHLPPYYAMCFIVKKV